jgi:leader peptidase (prepilin peptidase)/N-methyltransferase
MPEFLPVDVDPRLLAVLMMPLAPLLAFVWGLLWGSFANVVIYRVPRDMSVVKPRSHCPGCEQPIAWYDNIPVVSYLLVRGRCRRCGVKIPLRYLAVELLAGILSFTLYMQYVLRPLVFGGAPGLAAWLIWFCFGLALLIATFTDLDLWVIPNEVVLPVAGLGLIAAAVDPSVLGVGIVEALVAAAVGYGLVAGLRWVYLRYRDIEALGLGDGALLAMVGACCGAKGVLWTVAAGAIQALMIAVPLLVFGKKVASSELQEVHGDDPALGQDGDGVMGARVPFGPFLAVAALEYVLIPEQIDALVGLFAP